MDKRIDHPAIEKKWQEHWENSKCYSSVPDHRTPFTCIAPPANCTGVLHAGHAINNTYIDIQARYKRMKGFNVLIVPGTDHAGIATQSKVEKYLQEQGIDKAKLTREELIGEIWKWKEKYGSEIVRQLKRLGCSYDWQRLKFTLDQSHSSEVTQVFRQLYNDGLIYRGRYMVNWCSALETAISDEETVTKEITGKLYYLKYQIVNDNSDIKEYLIVATSRPETLFGDTAIAFHPGDERYLKYADCKVLIPLINKEIPIIQDDYVKKEFGSGLVKITPAHDKNDYEVGQRHSLPIIEIIDSKGNLTGTGTHYDGRTCEIARKIIIKELTPLGLIDKTEDYQTTSKICPRTGCQIEPRLTSQWFVKMKPLAQICQGMLERDEIKIHPERQIKVFNHWLDNIRDWCISRQLVWGHRIPIWTCLTCQKETCFVGETLICSCGSSNLKQDLDVLDTWFSSWLLPYSDFSGSQEDFNYYFPTDIMITGEDILFFWVIKMMMASGYVKQAVPFKKVFLHGLVRDEKNVKMTKTLGNVINPLDIIEKYGTDPMRFTLAMLSPKEHDLKISMKNFDIGKTFCTKYWNIVRFCLDNAKSEPIDSILLDQADLTILDRLTQLANKIGTCLDAFDYNSCGHSLYSFVWDDFGNNYLESTKKIEDPQIKDNKQRVLFKILETITRILHPFIPHLTEEIWEILRKQFNHSDQIVSLCSYP